MMVNRNVKAICLEQRAGCSVMRNSDFSEVPAYKSEIWTTGAWCIPAGEGAGMWRGQGMTTKQVWWLLVIQSQGRNWLVSCDLCQVRKGWSESLGTTSKSFLSCGVLGEKAAVASLVSYYVCIRTEHEQQSGVRHELSAKVSCDIDYYVSFSPSHVWPLDGYFSNSCTYTQAKWWKLLVDYI